MFARTERLLLRPSWPEDAEALFNAVAEEAIVRNLATIPWPYTAADANAFTALQHPFHYPSFLVWKRTGGAPELVGACGLGKNNGVAELGYWIARPYWGRGYATEAAKAVLGIAKTIGHRHIVAGHFADNPASGRVLTKIGFRATGKTELRESKGRGHADASITFTLDLNGDDDPVAVAGDMRMPIIFSGMAA